MINGLHHERKTGSILLISSVILLTAFSSVSALEITVKPNSIVKGDVICLGDIAQFDPSDDIRVAKLSIIEISASPLPGLDTNVSKDLLIYKINPHISGDKNILVKMPENLVVHRSAQLIKAGRMEEIFMGYIKANSPWVEEDIRFEAVNTPGTIALPEGKLRWDVQDKSNNTFIGNVNLTISFFVDGRLIKKVHVSGKVGVNKEIIKAAVKIDRGRIITEEDITLVKEEILHYRKNTIINKEDVIGKMALRTIQADQTILSNMLETPPLVKKGDKIIIKAENSELKVTTAGEALQDGQKGEQVEVLNIQSGRKILAVVSGSGIVEVFF